MSKRQTLIADLIDSADLNAKYDAQAKRLISMTVILAWILKSCVDEFKGFDIDFIMKNCFIGVPEISHRAVHMDMPDSPARNQYVPTMNSESSSINENTVRFDIRFKASVPGNKTIIELIVNVEIQVDASSIKRVIWRGIYYCGRMISEQYGAEFFDEDYENIKKVVSIWICPSVSKYKQNSIIEIKPKVNTVYGEFQVNEEDVDIARVIILNLNEEDEQSDQQIIRLLSVLLSDHDSPEMKKNILSSEFGISMTADEEKEVEIMCNLSRAVEARKENEINVRVATDMLKDGEPMSKIEKYSRLSEEIIETIAKGMGLAVVRQ